LQRWLQEPSFGNAILDPTLGVNWRVEELLGLLKGPHVSSIRYDLITQTFGIRRHGSSVLDYYFCKTLSLFALRNVKALGDLPKEREQGREDPRLLFSNGVRFVDLLVFLLKF